MARLGLIRVADQTLVEHDAKRVEELAHDMGQIRAVMGDSVIDMDRDRCAQVVAQPGSVFRQGKAGEKGEDGTGKREGEGTGPLVQKDAVELFVEKLYLQMKKSKHFANTLRELERLIKKHIVKKEQ